MHYLTILTGAATDSRQLYYDATKPNNTKSHTEARGEGRGGKGGEGGGGGN